jgi:hypothetical protein
MVPNRGCPGKPKWLLISSGGAGSLSGKPLPLRLPASPLEISKKAIKKPIKKPIKKAIKKVAKKQSRKLLRKQSKRLSRKLSKKL